ncbi:Bifunctional oligoribonuclease and PAP phosphatase nrnA [Clostridioides difficile]|uniref:DHH family phosphoesterase n=1 Tax=Clostridioides difficile TaxID=1496 RepID=UPI0003B286EC|nr:DHH family phosphoesterase [Clostridioides difficile]CCL13023.1 Putative signal transduction phosphoesterase [Clostridioides difficile E16]CCL97398.1 Putative signal transduction phosphoesterase [Clostridioides difficile T61]SJO07750.1 Bifunctional oligoribonuclease and PAP phosphatase nrnA [Clostridioides difficile]SJO87395.1 Bifunctional oligoribonuclease and PAP phosphatase nrnA [Clostridioides difficile]SJO97066.1 Bifunctional oligoribonuclease and PAP phosphatase nrnA [Clostridioides d
MSNKQTFKLNMPEINLYIIVIGISSIILLYYNLYVGCLFFCIFVYMVFHNWRTTNIRRHEWTEYIQNLSLDIDETTKKAIINLPIPLCILEFDGNISWYNGKFYDMIDQKDLLDKNIEDIVKNLNLRKVLNENKEMYTEINYKEKEYTIIYNVIKNDQEKNPKYLMILYWIDKTEYLKVKQNYDDEKNAMMLIQVDGYDEVLKSAAEDKRALINVEVEKILSALELNSNGALRRTSKDKFFLVMHKKELKKLEAEKFSILDTIRHIDYGNNLPVTISIGIGIDGDTLNENLKLATGALDLALGRGGDQAVVKTKDKFVFYGGKSKAVEKKTKVKSRLIGHALREVIQQSDQVYIMGHKYPDMDAMGAAVGVYDICKSCNKTANIVLQSVNESIEIFINKINENNYYKKLFIGKEEAIDNCTKNTLVVVVDTHRPNYTECEELLKLSEKVVVIDHHRRGVEFINDAVLLFHEIYVSSTCEMVTELVQYMDEDVTINKLTAEGLLAGISLDTKNFAFKTGVRTFEAASYLRKVGADTIEVKKFFNSDVKDFIIKAEIIQSTKIINNRICLAYSSTEIDSINVIIAQTADELLNIKEVEASFVLGEKDDTIFISARSLGQINVHVLMEKLGGGGHIDIAGAQLKNVSLKEAYKMVNKIIEEYLEEEE